MVRDLESLIEFAYLEAFKDELDLPDELSSIIVNPRVNDNLSGKLCIINKIYEFPNFKSANRVIFREKETYKLDPNPLISHLGIRVEDDIIVNTVKGVFFFSQVPESWLIHPCYKYLNSQLSN